MLKSKFDGQSHGDPARLRPLFRFVFLIAIIATGIFGLAGTALGQSEAPQNRARAVFLEAKALHDGTGIAQDLTAARALYRKAADMGSTDACINLGYMYFTGEGGVKSYRASRLWYKTAADAGSADAQRMMSVFYKNGLGVPRDLKAAKSWSDKADGRVSSPPPPPAPKPAPKPAAKPAAKAEPQTQTEPEAAPPAQTIKPAETQVQDAPDIIAEPPAKPAPARPPAAETIAQKPAPKPAPVTAPPTAKPVPAQTAKKSAPVWPALLSAAALALFGAFAVISERYRLVADKREREHFIRAFYARHRNILKSSYMAAQDHKGVIVSDSRDPWVKAALNLMTVFSQKHELMTGRPMRLTAQVIRERQTGGDVTAVLMPLMPAVEDVLIEDLSGAFDAQPAGASLKEIFSAMLSKHEARTQKSAPARG